VTPIGPQHPFPQPQPTVPDKAVSAYFVRIDFLISTAQGFSICVLLHPQKVRLLGGRRNPRKKDAELSSFSENTPNAYFIV
jgi:hypothetical protein